MPAQLHFAANLRQLRKQANRKQEDLAELVDKQANTIGNWENRKSEPSLSELILLADYFNVSLDELVREEFAGSLRPGRGPGGPGRPQPAEEPGSVQGRPNDRNDLPPEGPAFSRPGATGPEPDPETFWLLLRELRHIHDKLDGLREVLGQDSGTTTGDKADH